MRVLYAVKHADARSESYIRTEVKWMKAHGVEVEMVEAVKHQATEPLDVVIHRDGNLHTAVQTFKPDVIHAHWLHTLPWHFVSSTWDALGIPVTIRGHSFDAALCDPIVLAANNAVKKIWMLPPFAATTPPHDKISFLSACFDPVLFPPNLGMRPPRVIRAATGLPNKGIEEFFEIAKLCISIPFDLITTKYELTPAFDPPPNCHVHENLDHADVARLMSEATVYLRGCDPKALDFCMPVSVAEAMGIGLVPVLPNLPMAKAYAGPAGIYYLDAGQAAEIINELAYWNQKRWRTAWENSVARSEWFRVDNVLPKVLEFWETLCH